MRFFNRRRRQELTEQAGQGNKPVVSDSPVVRKLPEPNPDAPRRLTSHRVLGWLKRAGLPFFVDSDGDLGAIHESRTFYFLLFGTDREVFQVRGRWNRSITIERSAQVLEFCNQWNTKMIWPKAYSRVRDDGQIHVYGEVSMTYEYGITDEQIGAMVMCGLQTNTQLFSELNRTFPDPTQVAP